MKTKNLFAPLFSLFTLSEFAVAERSMVYTSTTDLKYITLQIATPNYQVESLTRGDQDPHHIDPKPSLVLKLAKADLVISVGLDLEIGWLPQIIQSARNPKIKRDSKGYLEVGPLVNPIGKTIERITRSQGDIHPHGNPHITLDPIRVIDIGNVIKKRLSEINPSDSAKLEENFLKFKTRMENLNVDWGKRLAKSGVKSIITYHQTFDYFLARFGIGIPIYIEPKPGISPTGGHLIKVSNVIKTMTPPVILFESHFDESFVAKLKENHSNINFIKSPAGISEDEGILSIENFFEKLVSKIESLDKETSEKSITDKSTSDKPKSEN